jgi:hypothetical protein
MIMSSRFFICVLLLLLTSCASNTLLHDGEYYGGRVLLDLEHDGTFKYYLRSESFVNEFGAGNWKQKGREVLITGSETDSKSLPIVVESFSSVCDKPLLFVKLLPEQIKWDTEERLTDNLDIGLVASGKVYPITNRVSSLALEELTGEGYFRVFVKKTYFNIEIHNDTLYSNRFRFDSLKTPGNDLVIDLDCNPLYFAQMKMRDDTLKISRKGDLRWRSKNIALKLVPAKHYTSINR